MIPSRPTSETQGQLVEGGGNGVSKVLIALGSRTKLSDFYTLFVLNCLKFIPFSAAHTHIALYVRATPPTGLLCNVPVTEVE